ncbi:hypothetical protein AMECASPLE_022717 [Ameca splendens]|uniref:Uncharacterized protein n=1 Tax=Ameca splendens TaxID=208324 RepID=A0ABV1ACU3_9TELE
MGQQNTQCPHSVVSVGFYSSAHSNLSWCNRHKIFPLMASLHHNQLALSSGLMSALRMTVFKFKQMKPDQKHHSIYSKKGICLLVASSLIHFLLGEKTKYGEMFRSEMIVI